MSANHPADLSPIKRALLAVQEMQARLDAAEQARTKPIAIIGMGCRFPGGATTPEAFWRLLEQGADLITEIPTARWDIDQLYDPDTNAPGKIATRWGAFLEPIDQFDPAFFGISPREAASMDPQQRLFLECAWEALEDAGQSAERVSGSRTGVFVGVCANDYEQIQYRDPANIDIYSGTGGIPNIIAGRLSYLLNLMGPCMAVDTACSSSAVTIHLACQSLHLGESTLAIAGGVNLLLLPDRFIGASRMQMMAPDGRCKTFDTRADGFVRGEGCGVVILKRLADALADGDPILALIRGSAVNQDGRSASLTAPSLPAQQAVIRQALANARVDPSEVSYIETHGTGTALGDPIEVEALSSFYGRPQPDGQTCILGSGKTNFGHLEAAAGVAGLIRTVLALRHETIPPHLHFTALNPNISLAGTSFAITTEPRPWPEGARRRFAGLSSFGWSGTNVHLVLEEAPALAPVADRPATPPDPPYLVPLSARSPAALTALALAYHAHLAAPAAPPLAHLAFTAACRRSHHPQRLALVADTPDALRAQLDAFLHAETRPGLAAGTAAPTGAPKLAFVIPGQGAQWPGMARPLLAQEPVFRQAIMQCAQAFQPFVSFSLLDQLQAPALPSTIDVLQPMLFAIAVGLGALWQHWGVRPAALVGHSMGEIAAAYLAGALTLEDAARVICRRSQLLRQVSGQGAMALVELSVDEAEALLAPYADRLSVAVCNSARETVIAGDQAALAGVLAQLAARQVFCRPIQVDVAAHSPQMGALAPALGAALDGLAPRAGQVPLYSTVEPQVLDGHELDASYWMRNLRAPVQFGRAIGQLADDGVSVFVELSPHPLLLGAIASGLRERGQAGVGLASLRREADARTTLLSTLGVLYTQGYLVEWGRLFPHGGQVVALPTYPWQRARYWNEPTPATAAPQTGLARGAGHPLLGARVDPAGQPGTQVWETSVSLATHAWLAEHQVQGRAVLPGAAYLELALAGARALWGDGAHTATAVFTQLLGFEPDEPRALQLALTTDPLGGTQFAIFSRPAAEASADWTRHASGQVQRAPAAPSKPESLDLAVIRERCLEQITAHAHYERLAAQGLGYGPAFQRVAEIWRRPAEALGRLRQPATADEGAYHFHPALLDAAFQVLSAAMPQDDDATYLPVGLAAARIYARPSGALWSYVRLVEPEEPAGQPRGDVLLLDADGQVLIEVRGMRLQRLEATRRDPIAEWLYTLAWQPQSLDPAAPPREGASRWLLIAETASATCDLSDALTARGGLCTLVAFDLAADRDALRVALQALAAEQPPCRDIVLLADAPLAEAGPPVPAVARHWARVVALVQALAQQGWRDAPRLWLVTRGAQAVTAADTALRLATAPLWGLGRTIMYEQPELRCTLLDLPAAALPDEADTLAAELLAQTAEDQVALRADGRFVARLQRYAPQAAAPPRQPAGERPFRLESDRPGVLSALTLRAGGRPAPGPGQVEIEVAAAGLNFLDVLTALGMRPGQEQGPVVLGYECAGRISTVGPGVAGFAVGDAVVACAPGGFATHVLANISQVAPMPPQVSFAEAAGLPLVFMTAYYGLHDLARLQPGERVLIHSAAGGVGLAAIQVARHLGAAVVATAGSEAKRAWLAAQGIRQVYDSRALAFAEQILAATAGQGVDVVLNSLAGAAIPASLAVLAPYGRFVEIGKKDIYANAALALAPFRKSLAYFAVDLAGMQQVRPALFHTLLRRVLERFADGTFQTPPTTVAPIAQVEEVFHTMAQGKHIGKLVLSLAERAATPVAPAEGAAAVDSDATYLVTGGLGGIGLAVARWLVERGARALVLLGRRAPTQATHGAIEELRARGATVRVAQADVADRASLQEVLDDIARALPPLRGIFHAAGVIDDGALAQMTAERFARVAAAKVAGAWHLHTLTRDLPLDHFVLFSSGAALLGSAGQANYAAANAFLDALAHARRAAGLPALSINWGPWAEVGLAAAQANRGERLSYRGIASMTPAQGLAALERLLAQECTQVGVLPLNLRQWRQFYPRMAAAPLFSSLAEEERHRQERPHGASSIRESLVSADPPQRSALLEAHLVEQVHRVLRLPPAQIDQRTPLGALGLDSLTALELRNRLEDSLELRFPVTLLWNYQSITALAAHLLEKIGLAAEQPAPPSTDQPLSAAQSVELEDTLGTLAEFSLEELQQTLADGMVATRSMDA